LDAALQGECRPQCAFGDPHLQLRDIDAVQRGGYRRVLGNADRDGRVQRRRRQPVDRRSGREIGRLDADDAPIIGARGHQRRLRGMQSCLAGGELRLGLRNVGRRDLAGGKPIARVFEGALQNAHIVLLHFEIGGVARYIHVGRCAREQHGFFHDSQCLARGRDLAFGFAHLIGGLLTVEQCLPGIDADRTRRGDALDGVGKTVGQGRRHRRKYARLIGILLADRSRGRERRAITGERLRYAFIILAHDGALSVELRIALVSARQRRLDGLCGDLARQGRKRDQGSRCRRRDRTLNRRYDCDCFPAPETSTLRVTNQPQPARQKP
jgi:hypothetical protein